MLSMNIKLLIGISVAILAVVIIVNVNQIGADLKYEDCQTYKVQKAELQMKYDNIMTQLDMNSDLTEEQIDKLYEEKAIYHEYAMLAGQAYLDCLEK